MIPTWEISQTAVSTGNPTAIQMLVYLIGNRPYTGSHAVIALRAYVNAMEEEKGALAREAMAALCAKQAIIDEHEGIVGRYEERISNQRSAITDLDSTISIARQTIIDQEKSIKKSNKVKAEVFTQHDKLRRELEECNTRNAELHNAVGERIKERDALQLRVNRQRSTIMDRDASIAKLKGKLAETYPRIVSTTVTCPLSKSPDRPPFESVKKCPKCSYRQSIWMFQI